MHKIAMILYTMKGPLLEGSTSGKVVIFSLMAKHVGEVMQKKSMLMCQAVSAIV